MPVVTEEVRSLVDGVGKNLAPAQVHDLLLRIENLVGARPLYVTGPGPTFVWRLADRGLAVFVLRSGSVGVDEFDWAERDAQEYQAFTWDDSSEYLPYLWRLPVDGVTEWHPGSRIMTSWAEFFQCFDACMNRMPSELAFVPPAWRSRHPAVATLWNLVSDQFVTAAVGLSAEGAVLDLTRQDLSEARIVVPVDRLGKDAVDLPAVLAGLTATGDLRELEFFDLEIDPEGFYPVGIKPDDSSVDPEDLVTGDRPPAIQTLDAVAAILAGGAPPASATPSAPTAPNDEGKPRKKWFWRR